MRTGVAAALLGVLLLAASPAGAQEPGAGADAGPPGQEREPPMPERPLQFRVGGTLSSFGWSAPDGPGIEVEDAAMLGAELETILFRYASARLATSYGRPRVASPARSAEVAQFLVELSVAGRAAGGPWTRWGLVPYAVVGVGSVVHAPEPDDLISENQNALSWGLGLEWTELRGFGARLEWRDSEVELGDIFEPQARGSTDRDAGRITGQIFWTF